MHALIAAIVGAAGSVTGRVADGGVHNALSTEQQAAQAVQAVQTVQAVQAVQALEAEVSEMEVRAASSSLRRALRSQEVLEQQRLTSSLHKWRRIVMYSQAFSVSMPLPTQFAVLRHRCRSPPADLLCGGAPQDAYATATQRARDAITSAALRGRGALLPRSTAIARATAATCAFLRLAGSTPARYQLLQRALGRCANHLP